MYLRDDPEADELGVDVEAILPGFLSLVQIISTGFPLDVMFFLFARPISLLICQRYWADTQTA